MVHHTQVASRLLSRALGHGLAPPMDDQGVPLSHLGVRTAQRKSHVHSYCVTNLWPQQLEQNTSTTPPPFGGDRLPQHSRKA